MIPKCGYRFSEKIMRKQERWSGMTIRRKVIPLQRRPGGATTTHSAGCAVGETAVWSADPDSQKVIAMRPAARTLRLPTELAAAGLVPAERLGEIERVAARYAVAISPAMAELIDPSDPHDPIARQFVPDSAELRVADEERSDPIGDDAN